MGNSQHQAGKSTAIHSPETEKLQACFCVSTWKAVNHRFCTCTVDVLCLQRLTESHASGTATVTEYDFQVYHVTMYDLVAKLHKQNRRIVLQFQGTSGLFCLKDFPCKNE